MIYLWRKDDGSLGMASDSVDREAAKAADLIDNWEPGSNLGMMLDSAQIIARQLGLFQNGWDRGDIDGDCVFPRGPLCLPAPLPHETMEESKEKIRHGWRRAHVVETAEGVYCRPISERRRIAR